MNPPAGLRRRTALVGLAVMGGALPMRAVFAKDLQTLRIGIAQEAGNLDLLQNESALSSYGLMFEGLVRYGSGGTLEPGLAERWEVAGDGRAITFHLRRGVHFSDGTPFDAEAARWNFARWIGKSDFSWIGISEQFQKLDLLDVATLRMTLKTPVPAALMELSIVRPVRFLSPKAVDAKGKQTAAIGTGPWKLVENGRSSSVLVPNPLYWGVKPTFSRIELAVVPDELSRVNALLAGDLDVIGGEWVAPLQPSRAKSLAAQPGVQVLAESGVSTVLLGYNGNRGPLRDVRVRRAVSLGLDRQAIAKVLYQGYAEPAGNLFPATIPDSGKRTAVPVRDVGAANRLLDDAGWTRNGPNRTKDGQALTLELIASDAVLPGARRLSEFILGQLGELGLAVKVSALDDATYHDRRQKFDYDLAFFGTYAAPYDPHGSLGAMFVSTADSGPDGKVFVSKALDVVVATALSATGEERRVKLQKVYDWLDEQQAVCPLVYPQRLWAHSRRIKGLRLPPTEYDMPIAGISLGA